jgi:hypothetical protein
MIHDIASNLTHRLHFPILDTPDEMSFPANYMFDHEYHLTLPGKQIRTKKLITTVRRNLGNPEDTSDTAAPDILSAH